MILKAGISLLFFLCYLASYGQDGGTPEKGAFKFIQKHRWEKAETKLRKNLQRDTLNPSIRYALSVFYFHPENPDFHLDSAYGYVVGALSDYERSPARERERLRRTGIDSLHLVDLRAKIDSAAFQVARKKHTEEAYLEFLDHFPSAVQRKLAVELRDEVAYEDALEQNTYEVFHNYMARYPGSRRIPEAKAHYHRLLYREKTRDERLSSYEKFLEDHPDTPYREEVYRNIFEISTADGRVSSFVSYMTRYPRSSPVKSARGIVFHLLADEEDPKWPYGFLNDSLQAVLNINKTYLVPFLKNDRYGFMDRDGHEVIPPRFRNIHSDYLCGGITDEMLVADGQLFARNGNPVFDGRITGYTDLGAGFLMVETAGSTKVIHKSGTLFSDSVQDARVVARRFIVLNKNGKWTLYTLTGRPLDNRRWDDITAFGSVIVLTLDERKFLVPSERIGSSADMRALPLSEPFDDVRLWTDGYIWGKSGDYEGLLNESLQRVIGFDKHQLTQTTFGALARVRNGVILYNKSGKKSSLFDQVNLLGKKLGVKRSGMWFLYDPTAHVMEARAYDSLRAEGAFIVGTRMDTVYVTFDNDQLRSFHRPGQISFVPGLDSTSFLTIEENPGGRSVFDLKGNKLFSATFDALEYAGRGLFVITRKDRKGLIDMRGRTCLPAEFDAISTAKEDVVSILKNRKFGAYHSINGKLIKPQYDRNLIPYSASSVVTFKDGHYGFLGWDNKPLSGFDFDEVRYWNDSLALVKKGALWGLFNLADKKLVETNLRSVTMIKDTPEEKTAIIQRTNTFGVITNRGQIVISPTFTEIINLGTDDEPLYFTEKHIPEASLYIVIYYDRTGEMLRKEIYDNAADYDRIYCSDK